MSFDNPLVSVIIPVYHADEYVREAIDSVLNQTFEDFECIIICDDPSEKTREILNSFEISDKRITVIFQEKYPGTGGLVSALNLGISLAKGKYIGRMDADDISLPERLQIQVEFMENHSDIGVCGTWMIGIGEETGLLTYPLDNNQIKSELFFSCPIPHPTVLIRKSVLFSSIKLEYKEDYRCAEDYGLWMEGMDSIKFSNINKFLLKYRTHPDTIGKREKLCQQKTTNKIRLLLVKKLEIDPSADEFELHCRICDHKFSTNPDLLISANLWLSKIYLANNIERIFPTEEFSRTLGRKWYEWCINSTGNGMRVWDQFWGSPLANKSNLNNIQKLKFFMACLVKIGKYRKRF